MVTYPRGPLGVGSMVDALEISGSSFTTLGFVAAPTGVTRLVAIVEALLGLAIVALMISFLPTIYGMFSRREIAVARLTTRAGEPPDPVNFITRLHAIDRLDLVGRRWEAWGDWFGEIGETHTTFPALVYFRSARADRSWLAAAEAALEARGVRFDVARQQAWDDYRGWRVNYDDAVIQLRKRIGDDPSHWSRRQRSS
jgi:hypothetical protein